MIMVNVPAAGSESTIVKGMRGRFSLNLIITKWPALAEAATEGASITTSAVWAE